MKNKLFLASIAAALAVPAAVAPLEVKAEADGFTDLDKNYWAHDIVLEMKNEGIINGYLDGSFKPHAPISREHVAVLFSRVLDLKPIRPGIEFTDVPKDYVYYDEIQTVYRAGIFDGTGDGTFGVGQNLTRAQMAKILHIAFNLKTYTGFIFNDVFATDWATDHITTLYMNGITTGDNGKYKPYEPVTRAHYAVFLHRALNLDNDVQPEQPDPEPELPEVEEPEEPETPTEPSEPETEVPTDLAEQLTKFKNENPHLFLTDAPVAPNPYYNVPLMTKMMIDGKDSVEKTNLRHFLEYATMYGKGSEGISLTYDGYVDPIRGGKSAFIFQAMTDGNIQFLYDFRLDSANELAKEWLQMAIPEYADEIVPLIDPKVKQARDGEQGLLDRPFSGNIQFIEIGPYRLQIGVNGFYERMVIQLSLQ